MAPIEVPADEHVQPRTRAPAALCGELHDEGVEPHGVVAGDDALLLVTEDLLEIDPAQRDERRRRVGRGAAEGGVVGGEEVLAQILVGRGRGGDPRPAQLVDEAMLEEYRCDVPVVGPQTYMSWHNRQPRKEPGK